jgi:hypothetical protein
MAVRWALTYKIKEIDTDDPANILRPDIEIDDINDANFDRDFFYDMRYNFKAPTRAFKSLSRYHTSIRMRQALDIASGKYNETKQDYEPTSVLVLKAGAFVMVGKTAELKSFVNPFPNKVAKISLVPGEKQDIFQVGYARVGKKGITGTKDKETLIIIAPQMSWWDMRPPKEQPGYIHTKESWREFVMSSKPVVAGRSIEMTTLASWLDQCDTHDPWVFPSKNRHEDNDPN